MPYYCCDCGNIFKEPYLWGEEESEVNGCPNILCKSDNIEPIPEEDFNPEVPDPEF